MGLSFAFLCELMIDFFDFFRSNIGGIIVAVMMQQLNKKHPDDYLLAMRILWAPIGMMLICWMFIPESPWHHVRRGDKEKAMRSLRQLYGGVEGYDFEEEFSIIARTIEHEKAMNSEKPSFRDVFRGGNLVSLLEESWGLGLTNVTFVFSDGPLLLSCLVWLLSSVVFRSFLLTPLVSARTTAAKTAKTYEPILTFPHRLLLPRYVKSHRSTRIALKKNDMSLH